MSSSYYYSLYVFVSLSSLFDFRKPFFIFSWKIFDVVDDERIYTNF